MPSTNGFPSDVFDEAMRGQQPVARPAVVRDQELELRLKTTADIKEAFAALREAIGETHP